MNKSSNNWNRKSSNKRGRSPETCSRLSQPRNQRPTKNRRSSKQSEDRLQKIKGNRSADNYINGKQATSPGSLQGNDEVQGEGGAPLRGTFPLTQGMSRDVIALDQLAANRQGGWGTPSAEAADHTALVR